MRMASVDTNDREVNALEFVPEAARHRAGLETDPFCSRCPLADNPGKRARIGRCLALEQDLPILIQDAHRCFLLRHVQSDILLHGRSPHPLVAKAKFTGPRAHEGKPPAITQRMEACSSAHHWARELSRLGHQVRLIPPQYVKPYVKRNKTDAADAEAICEAVDRPNMRFVPIKSIEQQSILALHRVRALLVRQRTSAVNAMRGLLSEFGIVAAKGIRRVEELRQRMSRTEPALLPDEARQAIGVLFDHLDGLQERVDKVEARIMAWHKASEASQRLASAPGVGPPTATAIFSRVGCGRQTK